MHELVGELAEAWAERRLAEVWRVARALAGPHLGPKQKRRDLADSDKPTLEEWAMHVQKPGRE
eukprot:5534942-Alexandrium_andersonii.AAC.1